VAPERRIQSDVRACISRCGVVISHAEEESARKEARMKDRFRSLSFGVAAVVMTAITLAAVMGLAQAAPGAAVRLSVRSSEYGKTLFGPTGKVVYVFGADRGSTSRCYGVCAKAWPPLLTTAAPLAGPGVKAGLLGTTKRKDGKLQVTYNGHPLYYYEDDKPGKIMCQHANVHGGIWLIVKPNGQPNTAKSKTKMHM
jgi:predicted lipoprotein with Yx(FWY)xxD motif